MEYIYSAMLLHSGGKEINEGNVKKVLKAAGLEVDTARIKALTASLEGVNIDEVVSKAAAPVPSAKPEEEKKEEKKEGEKKEKKEEKKEEVSEEEAAEGLGALFG